MKNKKKKLIPFDLERAKAGDPVITRDGRDVKILAFDVQNYYPIVGICKDVRQDKTEVLHTFTARGLVASLSSNPADLFMKPKKKPKTNRVGWINIYGDAGVGGVHETKAIAKINSAHPETAVIIKIKWYNPNYVQDTINKL